MSKMQDKPIAWMVGGGGIPVKLTFWAGRWHVYRPQQSMPARLDFVPEGNERLQPLDDFLTEAASALDTVPVVRVA